jgi:hypothetical protein
MRQLESMLWDVLSALGAAVGPWLAVQQTMQSPFGIAI